MAKNNKDTNQISKLDKEFENTIAGGNLNSSGEDINELRSRFKAAGVDVSKFYNYSRTHDNLIDQFGSLMRKNRNKDKDSINRVKTQISSNITSALETRDSNILNDFYYGEQGRVANYETYDQIFNLIPQLATIVRTVTDNVISPDDFSQMTIYSSIDRKMIGGEGDNYEEISSNIENLYERYDLESKIRKYVEECVYKGDAFVSVLSYAKEFNRLMNEDANLTEEQIIQSIATSSISNLQEDVEQFSLELMNEMSSDTDAMRFLTEDMSLSQEDANAVIRDLSSAFTYSSDYKSVLLSSVNDIMTEESSSNISNFSGSVVRFLDPSKVIKIKVGDTTLGYYYLEKVTSTGFGKTISSSSSPIYGSSFGSGMNAGINTLRRTGQAEDKAVDPLSFFTDIVINNIGKKINKKYLTSNPQFRDVIYTILRKNSLETGERGQDPVIITFIPEEECIHFAIGDDDYGHSIFENIIFTAKLYLTSLVSTLMQRMIRAPDKRVFSIETGLDEDYEGAVMSFVNDMKSKDITIQSLTGDIDTALAQVSAFKDIYIPVVDGKRPVEVDSFPGTDVTFDNDFLDYLLKSMIAGTGVPRSLIEDTDNIEFARTLAMQNGNFIRMIVSYQHMFERKFTRLVQTLYSNEYDADTEENVYDVEDIKTRLSSPMYIKIQSVSEVSSLVDQIATTMIGVYYNDDMSNPPADDADPLILQRKVIERRKFKKKIYESYMPQIDWSEMDQFFEQSKVEAYKELLMDKANKAPDEDPNTDDFNPQ